MAIRKMYYRLCSRSIIYDFDDSEPDPETDDHLVSNCFLLYSGEPSSCANKKTPDHLRICPCTNQGKSHCMCKTKHNSMKFSYCHAFGLHRSTECCTFHRRSVFSHCFTFCCPIRPHRDANRRAELQTSILSHHCARFVHKRPPWKCLHRFVNLHHFLKRIFHLLLPPVLLLLLLPLLL